MPTVAREGRRGGTVKKGRKHYVIQKCRAIQKRDQCSDSLGPWTLKTVVQGLNRCNANI